MKRIAWIVFGWSAFMATAQAASFDCEKASSKIEKMICSNSSLSAEDSDLAKAFDLLKAHIADKTSIITDQRNWLKIVRDKCETVACLQEAYKARTAYLNKLNSRLQSTDDTAQKCEVATPKQTKAGCKEGTAVCVENSNYSILQAVSNWCGKVAEDEGTQEMDVNVYLYPRKDSPAILVGTFKENETSITTGGAILWDGLDRNGFAELHVIDSCGNHNCGMSLYRFDPDQQIMYAYSDATSNADGVFGNSYFDGYRLNLSRGSQGSYRYDVFKVNQEGARDVVGEYIFSIDYDSANGCGFYKLSNGGTERREIKPPNKKWYKYCSPNGVPGIGEGLVTSQ